jgi:DNA-binding CsgD family transcriptional regulator
MDEAEFRKSGFFLEWCAPQALLDGCFTKFVARGDCDAWLTAIASERRGAINDNDRHLLQVLSPHLRRSLLISDLLRQQEERQAVFKQVLNRLSVPVMLVDRDARLVHANRAAEDILASDGPLTEVSGRLWSRHQPQRDALHHAISIACTQPDGRLGTLGNGIVLTGPQETFAAAYVLPLGVSDHRRALGPGNAAVFTTSKSGAKPPPVEVLSAVSGLTIAEARVSLAISDGTSTEAIAATLGISIHTLRKHLANVYDKTGLGNQAALAAFVNRLRTPLH